MMNLKKRALGRGLDTLLSTTKTETTAVSEPDQKRDGELKQLSVTVISRGKYQPRHNITNEGLHELTESIRAQGIIQPIVVRPIENNRYEIIAGERRWRAAQLAGLTEVPALIRHVPDESAIAMALIENIQRENLNPIEEAMSLERLLTEFAMTHQQVADAVGKSRPAISNLLRLLDLNAEVKVMVEQGQLSLGHAKVGVRVTGMMQLQAARIMVSKGLSVRDTERLIKKLQTEKNSTTLKTIDPDVQKLEKSLSDRLGTDVAISYNKKGRGKVVIHYYSLDQLDGILEHLN
jgi:ParB family transcriptional regulator, chromosome partitioning protein